MLTLELARGLCPVDKPAVADNLHHLWRALRALTNTRFEVEGERHLPRAPALFASNATHKHDLLIFRAILKERGLRASTVSKGKNWHELLAAAACNHLGSLPLMSRGYILAMDLKTLLGQRPPDALYRALRDHVDHDAPLPHAEPVLARVLSEPRDVLGARFDPAREDYRAFVRGFYYSFQTEQLLRLGREAIAQGVHIHMFPQGSVSSRLTRGRIGAVQLAGALGLPVIPFGMSGAPDVFISRSAPILRGGRAILRFGEPIWPEQIALPPGHRPFHPDDEQANRDALQASTDLIMDRLNDLLEPAYQRQEGYVSDGRQGTHRFI